MDKNTLVHYRSCSIDRRRYVFVTSALIASGLAATIGAAAIGGAAYGASALMSSGSKSSGSSSQAPGMPAMPTAPGSGTEATAAEKARIRKKTKTILTGPLTGGEDYGSVAPTLLGSGDVTKKATLG